jgi:TonB family protein
VVLVFFGEDNWGKLTDMSESGMSFEFSRQPALGERVNFTFQAMGCMPVPRAGEIFGESFEAAGEIVWTREFERIAGVQFVDLTEGNRGQIRQWLSFETSAGTPPLGEGARQETSALPPDLLGPLTSASAPETPKQAAIEGPLTGLAPSESPGKPVPELESPVTKEILGPLSLDEQRTPASEQEREPEATAHPNPLMMRVMFIAILGCLAALAVTAGIRMILTHEASRASAVAGASSPAAEAGKPTGAITGSSLETSSPFRVDVSDASGARWILWFVPNGSKNGVGQVASKFAASTKFSASPAKQEKQNAVPAAKPQKPVEFTLVAPKISRPASNGSAANLLSAEVPTMPAEGATSQEPIGSELSHRAVPAAPAAPTVGGMVQQARLIRSVPPIYPALARANRVNGDVVLDALIDAAGNVISVKAISGPPLLQQAAVETVRHWKYEPARLDGQAVAMHLTVTVRFRLN